MDQSAPAGDLHFLFRTDQGTISRKLWWRGVAMLAAPLAAFTAVWWLLSPYAWRGLDERRFIDPMTIITYLYLIIFAFAVMLIAVCFVNLSAKRLRARGREPGLAGLAPFAALLAGAAHWLYPRVADTMPWAIVAVCDLVLLAVIAWMVVELGLRDDTAVSR